MALYFECRIQIEKTVFWQFRPLGRYKNYNVVVSPDEFYDYFLMNNL